MSQRVKDAAREKALWASRAQGKQKIPHQDRRRSSASSDMDIDLATNPQSHNRPAGLESNIPTTTTNLTNGSIATLGDKTRMKSTTPPTRDGRKLAFQQYRQSTTTAANRSGTTGRLSMDMEYSSDNSDGGEQRPLGTASHASSSSYATLPEQGHKEDTFDMDMDQLQQNMIRLMIPRQVTNKVKRPQPKK